MRQFFCSGDPPSSPRRPTSCGELNNPSRPCCVGARSLVVGARRAAAAQRSLAAESRSMRAVILRLVARVGTAVIGATSFACLVIRLKCLFACSGFQFESESWPCFGGCLITLLRDQAGLVTLPGVWRILPRSRAPRVSDEAPCIAYHQALGCND